VRRFMYSASLLGAMFLISGHASNAAKPSEKSTCSGDYGTNVHFESTPSDAAKKADKEEKLVLVFHISGHFEDSDFT
jgi:hypothetical protein